MSIGSEAVIVLLVITATVLAWPPRGAASSGGYPELGELEDILGMGRPAGIAFLVREHNEDAYDWVLPRLEHYVTLVRAQWTGVPVVVVSHGEEMFSLLKARQPANAAYRAAIQRLVTGHQVAFQVCGAFAALSGTDAADFIDAVEVIDSAPEQITDYRMAGYRIIHLEPSL